MTPLAPPLSPSLFDLRDVLWIMHCAEGPVPLAAIEATRAILERELRPWELSHEAWLRTADAVRSEAARVVGGEPDDVTMTSSTSSGLTLVAQGSAWQAGDEVLAPLGEFPSNIWPWKALASRGVRFREVALWPGQRAGRDALASAPPPADVDPEAALLEAIGPRTRVVTVSWVRFQDGLVLDLPRLGRECARRGVALVVDGIQGAGTLPVPLEGVSAFATAVHKGLLAPQGAGFLWTAPAFRARLAPQGSWLSVEQGGDFTRQNTDHDRAWLASGRKLEAAAPSPLAFTPLASSLRLVNEVGPAAIARHVRALQGRLLDGLARLAPWAAEAERLRGLHARGRTSSILGLHHAGRGDRWLAALLDEGHRRRVFASHREGYLRVALHGWHGEADLERILAWLAAAPA